MRKTILVLAAALLVLGLGACRSNARAVDPAHNSRNSLNWDGVYTGTIPAADAEGINVQITLYPDETYEKQYEYIGKPDSFIDKGTFEWDETGSVIKLDVDEQKEPPYYKVGENILIQLDMEGKVITGAFADMYVLRKQPEAD
jgi:uncharacterized lipoprotein NlpE involved in copper resistance